MFPEPLVSDGKSALRQESFGDLANASIILDSGVGVACRRRRIKSLISGGGPVTKRQSWQGQGTRASQCGRREAYRRECGGTQSSKRLGPRQ